LQTARSKFYDECLAGDLGVTELNGLLKIMLQIHPDPLLNIRHRISNGQFANWDGCDAFSDFLSHRYSFYLATGETPESLFIVGHCIKRYNALFRIGIHSFISL
jgi:hypothetical protein